MNDSDPKVVDWRPTTWEGFRREQLRRWAKLSLEQIVLAQEEMRELAEKLGESKARRVVD